MQGCVSGPTNPSSIDNTGCETSLPSHLEELYMPLCRATLEYINQHSIVTIVCSPLVTTSLFNMPPKDSSASTTNTILLRRITIFIFLPAFPLLLAHGVAGNRPFPALGLLPLAGSAVLGGLVLYRDRVTVSGSAIQQLSASNVFFADVLLTALYLAILIASWVTLTTNSWRYDSSLVILGTYGTVGLLANL